MNGAVRRLIGATWWTVRAIWASQARLVIGLLAVMVATGVLPAATALVMRGLINGVVREVGTAAPSMTAITPWLLVGVLLAIAEVLGQLTHRYLIGRLVDDMELTVTADILTHASRLDVAWFERPESHDRFHRTQRNIANHFARLLDSVMGLATSVIQAVSLVAILLVVEPIAALIIVPLAFPHLVFRWRAAQRYHAVEHRRAAKRRWTEYFTTLLTDRRTVAEVRLLDLGPLLLRRFRTLMAGFRDENRRNYQHRFMGDAIASAVGMGVVYALLVRVVGRVLRGALTVGDVVVFIAAAVRLRGALEQLVGTVSTVREQALYLDDLRAFLDVRPAIERTGGLCLDVNGGEVAFDRVTFTYPESDAPAVVDLSCHIRSGETVALVGRNGAGKSTLIKLLARLYDPDSGRVLLNGVDVRELNVEYLHRQIGFVPQSYIRYEATAAENLAYGDWKRLLDDEAGIRRVAEQAGVADLIQSFPEGYATSLGRQFGRHDPSGGEWQQLAIARALARNAPLVILDEPTSNLDAQAEYEIFTRLRALARGRTTLLVSHRFSTVALADRILVLEEGRLVEQGTHDDLLAAGGRYATLYRLQRRQMDTRPSADA